MKELRAFILAAGLGTRLRPLTDEIPKPLLPVFNKPLIEFALDNLIAAGVEKIGFNTRYLSEKFYTAFSVEKKTPLHGIGKYREHPIEVFRELEHLDSGGGLRNARSFLEQSRFLIHNGDIFSNIPLKELIAHHHASGALVTLLLRENEGIPNVHFDEKNNRIVDLRNSFKKKYSVPAFAFASVAVAEPEFLNWIKPEEGPASTVDALLAAIKAGEHVAGLVSRSGFWSDLGTPKDYLQAHLSAIKLGFEQQAIAPSANIHASATLQGSVVIGAGATIERDVQLCDCLILPGTTVKAGAHFSRSIISPTAIITP